MTADPLAEVRAALHLDVPCPACEAGVGRPCRRSMASSVTRAAPKPLLPVGTYWCIVVSHHDGSAVLNAYGPYPSREAADEAEGDLRVSGVHLDENWKIMPLRLIDLGTVVDE